MDLLLDTCTFLWWAEGNARVPTATQALLRDPANRPFLSAASAWEIAIKQATGRLTVPGAVDRFVVENRTAHRIEPLPIDEVDALNVVKLPPLHKDPFDRLLVSQAIVRGCPIVTPDPAIRAYPCRTLWPE